MAIDPSCPPAALAAALDTPTAARLCHLSGLTRSDLATDLSDLIATAMRAAPSRRIDLRLAVDVTS